MPHGTPDWWGESPTSTIHQVTDAGELAVRMGSIDSYDRRGNVIWLTTFDDGLKSMHTATSGTGADVVLSAITAHDGAYSVKLVNGSDNSRFAEISKEVHPLVLSKVGLEFSWASIYNDQHVQAWIDYYDGTNAHRFMVRYDEALDKLQYWSAAPAWVDIETDLALLRSSTTFHTIKLVVDLTTLEYVRVLLNDIEAPLTGIAGATIVSAADPLVECIVYNEGEALENHYIWVDNVIITQNEP